jgi:hypothetical protein
MWPSNPAASQNCGASSVLFLLLRPPARARRISIAAPEVGPSSFSASSIAC